MSDKKIVHDLTVEDLIRLATKSSDTIVMDKLTEAGKFIYALGIKHGREQISAQLIYYTYKQWKGWEAKKQPKPLFFKDFKRYFNPHRSKDGTHYLLDATPFDTSEEVFWLIRSEIRNERAQKRKKEQKK